MSLVPCHVIIRGIERRRIVDDRENRQNFVSRMGQVASDTDTLYCMGINVHACSYPVAQWSAWPVKVYATSPYRVMPSLTIAGTTGTVLFP